MNSLKWSLKSFQLPGPIQSQDLSSTPSMLSSWKDIMAFGKGAWIEAAFNVYVNH